MPPGNNPKSRRNEAAERDQSGDFIVDAVFQPDPMTAEWRRLMERRMSPVIEGDDQDPNKTNDCHDSLPEGREPAQE